MIRATTPTITLTLPDSVDLLTAKQVYVTFAQDEVVLTKTIETGVELIEFNVLAVYLSQEETLSFDSNKMVKVQVNWIDINNAREATRIKEIPVNPNLIPKVIT